MPRMKQDDLTQISAELTTHYGVVPVNALAVLGFSDTVILRPGTRTADGQILTGAACAAALGDEYEVFPMGIEYALDPMDDALGAMDAALQDLEDALGDDEDALGAVFGKDLARRYMKVVARYRKVMSKIEAKPTRRRQRRADRRFKHLVALWQKMQRKGVDTSSLPSPMQLRRELNRGLPSLVPDRAPIESETSPGYFEDQAALEREMSSIMPSFGADDAIDLGADLDSLDDALDDLGASLDDDDDDLGAEFGGKDDLAKRYLKVVARYRKVVAKVEAKPTRHREKAADRRFERLEKLWDKMEEKDVDRSGLPSPESVRAEAEDGASDPSGSSAIPGYLVPAYAAAQQALQADLRADAIGYSMSAVEHDYYGLRGSDVEVLYADPDVAGDTLDEAEIAAEEDLDEGEGVLGRDGQLGVSLLPRLPGSRLRRMRRWASRGGYLTPRQAKLVARWRSKWSEKLSKSKRSKRRERLQVRISLANELLSKSAAIFGASDGEGVDYGRVVPKCAGAPGEPVIVIAIRKRPTESDVQRDQAGRYSANIFGGVAPSDPGLMDVLAADLSQFYRANNGYSAPEAMAAITRWTHPSNWVYGDEVDDLPFPMGGAAPLPPPRRSGNEVM